MRIQSLRPALLALSTVALLAACGTGGGVRRVSEPAASIQQLTVQAGGRWSLDVRLNNYSSVPMRFDTVSLGLLVDGQNAGTVLGQPRITVGPESADVTTLALDPLPPARLAIADALARGRAVQYQLQGTLDAAADGGNARSWKIERRSTLNPVPGLPGVLR